MARAKSGLVECIVEVVELLEAGPPQADNERAEPTKPSEIKTIWKIRRMVTLSPRTCRWGWAVTLGVMLRRNRKSNPVA
jgi:hypothetical protein